MTSAIYTYKNYLPIFPEDMDEGQNYSVNSLEPDPSLRGITFAPPLGPCPEEPEIVIPLDFLRSSGAKVDIIAPDWTPHDWLPSSRFWTPTLKIPYQKKISEAIAADYQGLILLGGTWNPAVLRTDSKMLTLIREVAQRRCPIFSICHGAQVLISAGLITKGLKVTGAPDIRIDLYNAGAHVIYDQAVVIDTSNISNDTDLTKASFEIISSRDPDDLVPFCLSIAEHFRQ